jgi:hypothetical protein
MRRTCCGTRGVGETACERVQHQENGSRREALHSVDFVATRRERSACDAAQEEKAHVERPAAPRQPMALVHEARFAAGRATPCIRVDRTKAKAAEPTLT